MKINSLENLNNQTPYAVEFPVLRKRIDKLKDNKAKAREVYKDLQQQHSRLLGALSSIALSLMEMELPDEAKYSNKLRQSIQSFNLMTPDYTKLCAALSDYLAKLPVAESKAANAAVIGRLMNNVKMGYYPTDLDRIQMLARGIEVSETPINLFDPCCGCGLALKELGNSLNTSVTTYGIELDDHRAEESLTRLNRVGFGSFYHS